LKDHGYTQVQQIINKKIRLLMINSTLEDLIRYMYNETNASQKAQIEKELREDWVLREKFNVLKESFERLNSTELQSPRQQSIDAIMKYACFTSKVCLQ
jgi:hypothetical protein